MSTHNICFHGEIRKICGYPHLSVAMDVQADLGCHSPEMPEDTFSHDVASIIGKIGFISYSV